VFIDEFDNGSGILKSVHVCDSGFHNHLHGAAQCLVSLLQQQGVFLNGNDVISIAADVQQRDGCTGQWLQVVDGAECFFGQHLFIADVVDCLQFADFSIASFSFALSHWPAADIADRGISEDAGNLQGVGRSPVIAIKTAAAGANECWSRAESVFVSECLIDLVPVTDCCGGSEKIAAAGIDNMEASSQQSNVWDGSVSEEFSVPDPWLAVSWLPRDDHGDGTFIHFKVSPDESIPCAAFTGKFCVLCLGLRGEHQQGVQQQQVQEQ